MLDVKLRIDRNIAACCGSDSSRFNLSAVQLTADYSGQVFGSGTDGRCLSISRVEGSISESVLMPGGAVPKVKAGGDVVGNGTLVVVRNRVYGRGGS